MSTRVNDLLASARAARNMWYLRESAELGDLTFVRTTLEAWWAAPHTPTELIEIAQYYLLFDRAEAVRRVESVAPDNEEAREAVAEFWRAADPLPMVVETAAMLAEREADIERDRRSSVYEERLVALAESYLQAGCPAEATRIVARCDERDRGRRSAVTDGFRLAPLYLTLARLLLDADEPQRAIKLAHDICDFGREGRDPAITALAAHAFAIFGERDEAARLADGLSPDTPGVNVEVAKAWIEIDRACSFEHALTRIQRLSNEGARANMLLALARYAYRIDVQGHVPLPDDAPQPPPRVRLIENGALVPAPRVRLK